MKKLSLALALVFALSCCMLASCGGDEESSAVTSSAAASSAATSSAAVSSEAASSAEASSAVEESSEVEVSSEDPVETSSESPASVADATEGVEPSGENLALSATITGAEPNESTQTYSASLNDGAVDTALDGSWFAYLYNSSAPEKANAADGVGVMVIDLGEVKEISAVRLHTFVGNDWGITAPGKITFEFSEDGENYVKFGEKVYTSTAEAGDRTAEWVGYTLSAPANAQYVRVSVTLSGVWAFMNEVEVY